MAEQRFKRLLSLTDSQYHKIRTSGRSLEERCGVLVGRIQGAEGIVTDIRLVRNIADRPGSYFEMHPQEYFDAIKDTKWVDDHSTLDVLGIFHTHPGYPGYPSRTDWDYAEHGHVIEGAYLIYTTRGDDIYYYYWDGTKFLVMQV